MNSTSGLSLTDAEGIETYILNNATDASSRRLAHLENQVLNPNTATNSPEQLDVALILKDLRLDANLSESKRLACVIQDGLVHATRQLRLTEGVRRPRARLRNRGVKQALFHVLLGADMPSVLVEAGFLSNARDRALVLSSRGQQSLSSAIVQAVEHFRKTKGTAHALSTLSRCKVH
jgi:N-acetylmuramoyl-L-alanine amidase